MLEDRRGRLDFDETLEMCTSLDDVVRIYPGPVDPQVVALLEDQDFSQAPVTEPGRWDRVLGLVQTSYLRTLGARRTADT